MEEWLGIRPETITVLQETTGLHIYDLYQLYDLDILRDFPEMATHDFRGETRMVEDSEGEIVTLAVVRRTAELIARYPALLIDYALPEVFTRVRRRLERNRS